MIPLMTLASKMLGVPLTHVVRMGTAPAAGGTPSLREVRAEGWSELSPRCVGAAARRAGLSPSLCDAPISRRPVCFLLHTLTPLDPRNSEDFSRVPMDSGPESSDYHQLRERSYGPGGLILEKAFSWRYRTSPLPRSTTFLVLGVAGGTMLAPWVTWDI